MTIYNSIWKKVHNGGNLGEKGTLESSFGIALYNGKNSLPVNSVGNPLVNQYIMLSKVNLLPNYFLIFKTQTADTLLEIGERKDESSEPYLKFKGAFNKGRLVFLSKLHEKEGKTKELTFSEFKNEIKEYFKLNSFDDFQKFFYVEGLPNEYPNSIKPLLNPSSSENWHDLKVGLFGKRESIKNYREH